MDIKKTTHSNHNSEHRKKPKYNLVASLKKMTSSPMVDSQITTLQLYLLITRIILPKKLLIALYQAAALLIGKMMVRIILILMIILINRKYLPGILYSTEMMKNQRKAKPMQIMIVTNKFLILLLDSIIITHKVLCIGSRSLTIASMGSQRISPREQFKGWTSQTVWLSKSLMNCLIMK